MTLVEPPRPLIEGDDGGSFDCGRDPMNLWFRRHAWASQASGAARVNLLVARNTGRIVAYVALSAAQIERAYLPKAQQRNRPDPVPVTLLGQLAVDRADQGQGHAASLLVFAFRTALHVGSVGVLTHPLDNTARRFYARWGFADLPFDPRRAMFIRMVDLRLSFGFS